MWCCLLCFDSVGWATGSLTSLVIFLPKLFPGRTGGSMTGWFWWPWVTLKGGVQGQIFQADFLSNTRIVWPRTSKFRTITHCGEEHISTGQPRPYRKALTNYWGSFLWRWTTKFDVVAHVRTGLFFGSQPHPEAKGGGSQRSPFLGSFIYVHTLCRRTTKFDAVTGNGVYQNLF